MSEETSGERSVQTFLKGEAWEDYSKVLALQESKITEETVTTPYKSKYEARAILEDLKRDARLYFGESPVIKYTALQAAIEQELAINHFETEEISTAEELFLKAQEMLKNNKLDIHCVFVYLRGLNHLGILWTGRDDLTKALLYLTEANSVYATYHTTNSAVPYTIKDLFLNTPSNELGVPQKAEFEHLYTHTAYYLAQVYQRLGDKDEAARYCILTLKRQLESKRYDAKSWALDAAALSQYYLGEMSEDFPTARHCLASASFIIDELGPVDMTASVEIGDTYSEESAALEQLQEKQASIARCWAKFAIELLAAGVVKYYDHSTGSVGRSSSDASEDSVDDSKHVRHFSSLELTKYEEQIRDDLPSTFSEAKEVFLFGQRQLEKAKLYFTSECHASDFVSIIQDMSKLYKLLSVFDPSLENRCKMHKRRIEMLKKTNAELNPQYFLLIQRQLLFEIGEAYSNMMDLKLTLLEMRASQVPDDDDAVSKINKLAEEGIHTFKVFLKTTETTDGALPERFSNDVVKHALLVHFYIGRFYSKMVHRDTAGKVNALQHCVEHYKEIVNYCDKHSDQKEVVESEYNVCKEMVTLLPMRIRQLTSGAYGEQ